MIKQIPHRISRLKDIEKSRKEYERGETATLEELKKELKIS